MPPRVLIVAPSLDILGGQSVQAVQLLSRLRQEPSLEVAFLPINPRLPGLLRLLQRMKYVRTLVTSIVYVLTLLVRIPRYDVIHVFSASYFSFLLAPTPAILVAKLFRKRVVLNYRSGEANDHLTRWHTAVWTMRLADVIVVPSGYLVDVFARFGLNAQPIPNTIEIPTGRERRALRPLFLANRNFETHYNVACILRAFAIIQRHVPDARLMLAGDGPQRVELMRLASSLGLTNTSFLGRVTPERMQRLYGEADIYLNAPDIDNMPVSVLEAFASGLPVVTTNAGGIPYIVTHEKTGLMVPCGDYQRMAACAIRLLEDSSLASRIIAAARGECAKYGWHVVRSRWLDVYRTPSATPARADAKNVSGPEEPVLTLDAQQEQH